ncbi:glycosyltransferase family A protein [Desulforamulus aquiferis]|uniref:Glycosyltransferase family A protein n=1 Tax=Desulforamulus aquiferis TaxID=1397668 RepID=A0AAW7ZGY9_9FIRM|nr:glycosyltransferase family A protein [Desulforamulus aquiferis]MDO7789034.1 glycosyltransferase family A protein [Desulforamulus aquiferis]
MYQTLEVLLVVILACYGVYRLAQDVISAFRVQPGPPVSMLIVLKDRAQDVEYIIRRLAAWRKHQWVQLELVVVDDGSEDDTAKILEGLQQRIPFRLVALESHPKEESRTVDQGMISGLLHCHNSLVWLVDLRRIPTGLQAEKVFRVFFCQGWR